MIAKDWLDKSISELSEAKELVLKESWNTWKQIANLQDKFAELNIERGVLETLIAMKLKEEGDADGQPLAAG